MVRRIFWLMLVLALVIALPVLAQNADRYVDPNGRFSAPIPYGWKDRSTDQYGHLVNEEPAAEVYLLVADNGAVDSGISAALKRIGGDFAALADTKPAQSSSLPLASGAWTQNVYVMKGMDIVAAVGQVKDGVTYVLIFHAAQADFPAVSQALNQIMLGFTFSVEETLPDYVQPDSFEERDVQITTGDWTLPGTLTLPKGDGPFPAVVLVHGSGPEDRDETIGANKPFRDLAWGLASSGIAVLRYDKRTLVYKAKSATPPESITVKEETIEDALSAVKLLRVTRKIDLKRVFVLGHSLGGMLAPRIGAADAQIAGLIMMAGSTRLLPDMMVIQTQYLAELDGTVSDDEKARIAQLQKAVEQIKNLKPGDTGNYAGAPAAYWLDLDAYDPVKVARTLAQPMLILQGERDYQVTVSEDFKGWQEGLADHPNVTFKTYPTLNHLFLPGEGQPNPNEYAVPGHIPAAVISDIAAWIKAH
jgi:dienelactone hydrolase